MADKSVADMKSELIELLGKKSTSTGISNNSTKKGKITELIGSIKNEDAIKELYKFVTDPAKGKAMQKEVHETASGIKENTEIGAKITELALKPVTSTAESSSAPAPKPAESSSAPASAPVTGDIAGTAASIIGDINAALAQIKTIVTTKGDLTNPTIVSALTQLSATIGSPTSGSPTSGSSTTPMIIPFLPPPNMNINFDVKVDSASIYKEKGRWGHFKAFFTGKTDNKDAKKIASLYTIVVKLNFILYKLIKPTNKLNSLGSGALEELIEETIRNTPKDAPTIISNLIYTKSALQTLVLEKVIAEKALNDATLAKTTAGKKAGKKEEDLIQEAQRKVAEVERASTALLNGRRKYLNEEAPYILHPPLTTEMLAQDASTTEMLAQDASTTAAAVPSKLDDSKSQDGFITPLFNPFTKDDKEFAAFKKSLTNLTDEQKAAISQTNVDLKVKELLEALNKKLKDDYDNPFKKNPIYAQLQEKGILLPIKSVPTNKSPPPKPATSSSAQDASSPKPATSSSAQDASSSTSSSTNPSSTGLASQSSQQEVNTRPLDGSSTKQTKQTSQSGISALGPAFNSAGMPRRTEQLEDSDSDDNRPTTAVSSSRAPKGGLASQGQSGVDTGSIGSIKKSSRASVSYVDPAFSLPSGVDRRPEQLGDEENDASPPAAAPFRTKANVISQLSELTPAQLATIPESGVTQAQYTLLERLHNIENNPFNDDGTNRPTIIQELRTSGIPFPQAGGAISSTDIYTPLYTEFYNILHTLSRDREFSDESQKKIMTSMIEFITQILNDFRDITSLEGIKGGAKTLRRSTQKKMRS